MITDRTYEEAADWLARQQDDAMDWDGFTLWLEADPAHRAAFDELAILDRRLDDDRLLLARVAANSTGAASPARGRLRRYVGLGGGVLAAAIAALLFIQPAGMTSGIKDYRSRPGQTLELALAGGTRVLLAPTSHLRVKGTNLLLQGDAYFDVPHKAGRALTVTAGAFVITDIGTRFSVESDPMQVRVEVAQGSLTVSSNQLRSAVGLSAGRGMSASTSEGAVRLFSVAADQVASWRSGKLEFDGVPLALVAREISRYSGKPLTVDARIANRPFSGIITIHEGEEPARTLAQILSLDITQTHGALRLEPRGK